jgi:hypothetical protein
MHDKVPSTKYKDQTLSQTKFDDRTKSERIKDPSQLFPRMFFKQSPFLVEEWCLPMMKARTKVSMNNKRSVQGGQA